MQGCTDGGVDDLDIPRVFELRQVPKILLIANAPWWMVVPLPDMWTLGEGKSRGVVG
jgi:hypothetical protein